MVIKSNTESFVFGTKFAKQFSTTKVCVRRSVVVVVVVGAFLRRCQSRARYSRPKKGNCGGGGGGVFEPKSDHRASRKKRKKGTRIIRPCTGVNVSVICTTYNEKQIE